MPLCWLHGGGGILIATHTIKIALCTLAGEMFRAMGREELVHRQRDPEDRRKVRAYLTESARALVPVLPEKLVEMREIMARNMSEVENVLLSVWCGNCVKTWKPIRAVIRKLWDRIILPASTSTRTAAHGSM